MCGGLEETEETSEGNQNELIFCEGAHAHARTGCYHPLCVNPALQAQPKGEWLCPECVASGLRVMEDVVGKRKPDGCRHGANATGRVQYQIKWQGEAERTWEFRSNIQGRPLGDRTCCCLVDPHVLLVVI